MTITNWLENEDGFELDVPTMGCVTRALVADSTQGKELLTFSEGGCMSSVTPGDRVLTLHCREQQPAI